MSDPVSTDETEKAIRERAHAIWEEEGRPEGREADHWRQAMMEITGLPDDAPSEEGGSQSYSEKEQPSAGEPELGSGLDQAVDQAGEAAPAAAPGEIPGKPTGSRALPKSRKPRG